MVDLRKDAKGRECQIRLSGICNGDPETTVLAHYRLSGISGIGMKSPDAIAAWACSSCHDACDRRSHKDMDRDFLKLALAEGVFRTWMMRMEERELNEAADFFMTGNGGW